ncbi:translation initiation factor IF-2 [Antechinus flavipes]|uniref:translation initiation factor IF-2 n=1 Tax=Antechinus flavipes TaxID=38775 RepID=UPI00223583F7|nr:translation initiation factor IF-2 [Antechinus flavipes]
MAPQPPLMVPRITTRGAPAPLMVPQPPSEVPRIATRGTPAPVNGAPAPVNAWTARLTHSVQEPRGSRQRPAPPRQRRSRTALGSDTGGGPYMPAAAPPPPQGWQPSQREARSPADSPELTGRASAAAARQNDASREKHERKRKGGPGRRRSQSARRAEAAQQGGDRLAGQLGGGGSDCPGSRYLASGPEQAAGPKRWASSGASPGPRGPSSHRLPARRDRAIITYGASEAHPPPALLAQAPWGLEPLSSQVLGQQPGPGRLFGGGGGVGQPRAAILASRPGSQALLVSLSCGLFTSLWPSGPGSPSDNGRALPEAPTNQRPRATSSGSVAPGVREGLAQTPRQDDASLVQKVWRPQRDAGAASAGDSEDDAWRGLRPLGARRAVSGGRAFGPHRS